MKTTQAFLLGVFLLLGCSSPDIINQAAPLEESTRAIDSAVHKSKLFGIWWDAADKDAPVASFVITDSIFHYPDHEDTYYRYSVRGDSLLVFYDDGYISVSKINKATGDTLELTTHGEKAIFIKLDE